MPEWKQSTGRMKEHVLDDSATLSQRRMNLCNITNIRRSWLRDNSPNVDFYVGSERYNTFYQTPQSFTKSGDLGSSLPSLVLRYHTADAVALAGEIAAGEATKK